MQLLNEFNRNTVRGDIFGGITAAVIALPMALAFGVASGAGPAAGLYGAILVGLFASVFGGSPTLMSEPTGPMTVVFTAVIAKLIASDPVNGMAMAFTVVVMAGAFQILFSIMKLGKYVTLMPYNVVSGFMSGIGIILIVLQLGPLIGHATPPGGVVAVLESLPQLLADIHVNEAILAVLTIGMLYLTPGQIKRYVPPQLLALLVVSVVSILLMGDQDIRRIGEIPTGLPDLQLPVFSIEQWQIMFVDAIVLGVLGCIDALLTSVIADSLTRQRHNSDKELLGQGIGNIMSGLFGGLPGAGATMGTVVSIQAGARSAWSGIVRVSLLVIVVLWAADLTANIPLAVLAGIAFKVGVDIIDWGFLRRAHVMSGNAAFITYGVILLTVFVDLIVAVGIGLFVANIFTIMKLSTLQESNVRAIKTAADAEGLDFSERELELLKSSNREILLLYMRGSMIFGTSRVISRRNSDVKERKTLIVDLSETIHLGVSASLALEASILDMLRAGRQVLVVVKHDQPYKRLRTMGIVDRIPVDNFFEDRANALHHAIYGEPIISEEEIVEEEMEEVAALDAEKKKEGIDATEKDDAEESGGRKHD